MALSNLRFMLQEIELFYDGDEVLKPGQAPRVPDPQDDKSKDNIVEACLTYPRSGVPVVTSCKTLALPSGYRVKLDADNFWEAGLFKEDVDGETQFELSVSDKDPRSKLGNYFRSIFSTVFNTALGGRIGSITNLFQGAVASDMQDRLVSCIKGEQKDNALQLLCKSPCVHLHVNKGVATAYYVDDKGQRVNVLNGNVMTLDLLAVTDLTRKTGSAATPGSNIRQTTTETLYKKGQPLGEAKIRLIVG
jgi:hypothetical protein